MGGSRGGFSVGGYTAAHLGNLNELIKFVDGAGSGIDADMVDGLDSSQFLRSDTTDSLNGKLMVGGIATPSITLAIGDNDTGLNWVTDGAFKLVANNVDVAYVDQNHVDFFKSLQQNGVEVSTKTDAQSRADTAYNNALNWAKSFGLGTNAFLLSNNYDLNGLTTTGFYRVMAAVNAPPRVSGDNPSIWHYVINIVHDTSWQTQIAIEYSTGTMFTRTRHDGNTWTSWAKSWTDANMGSGSGLDADLVDGHHLSEMFHPASQPSSKNLNDFTESYGMTDIDTGFDTWTNTPWGTITTPYVFTVLNTANQGRLMQIVLDTYHGAGYIFYRIRVDNNWSTWIKLWNSGDMGSGSGLDSDLIDGLDSSQFLRSDTNDTLNGLLSFADGQALAPDATSAATPTKGIQFSTDSDTHKIFMRSDTSGEKTGLIVQTGDNNEDYFQIENNDGGTVTKLLKMSVTEGVNATVPLKQNGNQVWHTGNDGSGSGMDADLLDGLNSSQFLRSDTTDWINGSLLVGGNASPSVTLAIGDNDTGLNWVGDGHFQIKSNGDNIADIYPGNIGLHKQLFTDKDINITTDGMGINFFDTAGMYKRIGGALVLRSRGAYIEAENSNNWRKNIVSQQTLGNIDLYVDPNGNDSNDGLTISSAFRTIQAALDSLPGIVATDVRIHLSVGTYDAPVTIYQIGAGMVSITGTGSDSAGGGGSEIIGGIRVIKTSGMYVDLENIKVTHYNYDTGFDTIHLIGAHNVAMMNVCVESVNNNSYNGITLDKSIAVIQNIKFYNNLNCVLSTLSSHICIRDCNSGGNNKIGIGCNLGSIVGVASSSIPADQAEITWGGGVIYH